MVKNPPANAGNVGDMGSSPRLDDPLEEEMKTHSSILAWRIRMDRAAWQATVHGGHKRVWHHWVTNQQQNPQVSQGLGKRPPVLDTIILCDFKESLNCWNRIESGTPQTIKSLSSADCTTLLLWWWCFGWAVHPVGSYFSDQGLNPDPRK